ncbi:hypothetical protein SAMN04488033_104115 [Salegentibacter agarivorans]|uniref:DUF7793 domain-containing protein n=1 Tax=Salegentibacter agarivorans TaxID=345907 RepID=A0A1I2KRA5_9FLAO|nr:hypothetical protein [Salegentibacter agarivorans]SFF68770.1 hypothetical protein SAMN04488033_104115 [Salegentibacter agarivorans]
MIKRAQNNFAEVWIENDILYFVYAPLENLSLDIAKNLLKLRLSIQNNKEYPILCDLRKVIQADKEAMDYLAKEGSVQATAVALLVQYPHTKSTAQFYLSTSIPKVDTEVFEDKLKALAFLSHYPVKN